MASGSVEQNVGLLGPSLVRGSFPRGVVSVGFTMLMCRRAQDAFWFAEAGSLCVSQADLMIRRVLPPEGSLFNLMKRTFILKRTIVYVSHVI